MEPTITCLDTATWLTDFKPEDIPVGAIISYYTSSCDPSDNTITDDHQTTHRVIEAKPVGIKADGTQTCQFSAQGDANDEPDDCKIHSDDVTSYIIELHKDAVPQNTILRRKVNGARERYERCLLLIERAIEARADPPYCGEYSYNTYTCWLNFARNPVVFPPRDSPVHIPAIDRYSYRFPFCLQPPPPR